jgi:hypothetical protein
VSDEPERELTKAERDALRREIPTGSSFAEARLLGAVFIAILAFGVVVWLEVKIIDAAIGWDTFANLPISKELGRLIFVALCVPPMIVATWVFRNIKPRASSWG